MTWHYDPDASIVLAARTAHLRNFKPLPPAALVERSAVRVAVTAARAAERMTRLLALSVTRSK